MILPVVISFFDYTGHAVREWAAAGHECHCYDSQHPKDGRVELIGAGSIHYHYADLAGGSSYWRLIRARFAMRRVVMVYGFPPCTDLAVSGALHFERKRQADPDFQTKAVAMAVAVAEFAEGIGSRYVIENPNSVLSTLWRKPDQSFDPCDFGGYLPEDDAHPRWPQYIAPRDAYTKLTNLWTSAGLPMPIKQWVEPEILERVTKSGRTIR
jgi:hypothetical protein